MYSIGRGHIVSVFFNDLDLCWWHYDDIIYLCFISKILIILFDYIVSEPHLTRNAHLSINSISCPNSTSGCSGVLPTLFQLPIHDMVVSVTDAHSRICLTKVTVSHNFLLSSSVSVADIAMILVISSDHDCFVKCVITLSINHCCWCTTDYHQTCNLDMFMCLINKWRRVVFSHAYPLWPVLCPKASIHPFGETFDHQPPHK